MLSGCSTAQPQPQIIKVPQKCVFEEPKYPELHNPKDKCDKTDRDCIEYVLAFDFVSVVEYAMKYKENAGVCR